MLRSLARRFADNEDGGPAIEYSLVAALMAIVVIGGMTQLSGASTNGWNGVANKVANAMK